MSDLLVVMKNCASGQQTIVLQMAKEHLLPLVFYTVLS